MSATNVGLKICFIGPSGAGKTTLARRLSRETGIPHIPFDEIPWYSETSRLVLLREICVLPGTGRRPFRNSASRRPPNPQIAGG
uniref:ATP-binding protein n=1 Tax=Cupriavidus ulmosensis TaxID=3065913 RepID=UPI003F8336FF